MNARALIRGDHLAAVEFDGRTPTFTITGVRPIEFEDDDHKKRRTGIVTFKETDRSWVLNRTNLECLVSMWGTETDNWTGKRVQLYAEMVRVGNKTEPGIRVKGSPDLQAPVDVVIKLPRRKPFTMQIQITKP